MTFEALKNHVKMSYTVLKDLYSLDIKLWFYSYEEILETSPDSYSIKTYSLMSVDDISYEIVFNTDWMNYFVRTVSDEDLVFQSYTLFLKHEIGHCLAYRRLSEKYSEDFAIYLCDYSNDCVAELENNKDPYMVRKEYYDVIMEDLANKAIGLSQDALINADLELLSASVNTLGTEKDTKDWRDAIKPDLIDKEIERYVSGVNERLVASLNNILIY